MTIIQAIETLYAGCRFRSRLEARWAVAFDSLGWDWRYEPEGFEYSGTDEHQRFRYLPDFHLPKFDVWVEVKGSQAQLHADGDKIAWACDWGSPLSGVDESDGTHRGLLILGDVPRPAGLAYGFLMIQHHKGIQFNRSLLSRHAGPIVYSTDHYGDASCNNDLGCIVHPGCTEASLAPWSGMPVTPSSVTGARWQDEALTAARSHRFDGR